MTTEVEKGKRDKVPYDMVRKNQITSNNELLKKLNLPTIPLATNVPMPQKKGTKPTLPTEINDELEDPNYVMDGEAEMNDDYDDDYVDDYDDVGDGTNEDVEVYHPVPKKSSSKKRKVRGPTRMLSIWEGDKEVKIHVKINKYGQPCGVRTSNFTNFIASLVKGGHLTLKKTDWRVVEGKHKIWDNVIQFFHINPICEDWVLASAGKKWRDFKNTLKKTYYNENLSVEENIANGCKRRIPDDEWKWLVEHWTKEETKAKAKRNQEIRANQTNALHTCGSRSYAVINNILEGKLGREPCRAETYLVTHKKRNGEAINVACKEKIDEIEKRITEDEDLRMKSIEDGDLYADVHPVERKGRVRGLGLLAGGSKSVTLAKAVAALKHFEEENEQLKSMVTSADQRFALYKENAEAQFTAYKERSEQQYNELKSLLLGLQGGHIGQQKDREPIRDNVQDVGIEKVRLQESSSSDNRINDIVPPRIQKIPPRKQQLGGGKEVALRSLGGSKLVAYGRLQRTDKATICADGLPLGEYFEVLVDVVLDNNVLLPRAQHKVTKLGGAFGVCITWPIRNIMEPDGSPLNLTRRSLDFRKKM